MTGEMLAGARAGVTPPSPRDPGSAGRGRAGRRRAGLRLRRRHQPARPRRDRHAPARRGRARARHGGCSRDRQAGHRADPRVLHRRRRDGRARGRHPHLLRRRGSSGFPAAKLGVGYPHEATSTLVSLVGPGQAAEILFAGRRIDADEAPRIGLVNRVFPKAELDDAVDALAREIAGQRTALARSRTSARFTPPSPADPAERPASTKPSPRRGRATTSAKARAHSSNGALRSSAAASSASRWARSASSPGAAEREVSSGNAESLIGFPAARSGCTAGSSIGTTMCRATHVRVVHHRRDVVERTTRDPGRFERVEPLARGPRCERAFELRRGAHAHAHCATRL